MTAPLGPDALLLLCSLPEGHPMVEEALEAIPTADAAERDALLSALLAGPFAKGKPPKEVVAAVAARARELSGTVTVSTIMRLRELLTRYTDHPVPAALADAAWATGANELRLLLLRHPQVPDIRKKGWLHVANVVELSQFLTPETTVDVLSQVVAEAARRGAEVSAYTAGRTVAPGIAERLLTAGPVDSAALAGLCAHLPRTPSWHPEETNAERELRESWKALIARIARTQPHLTAAVHAYQMFPEADPEADPVWGLMFGDMELASHLTDVEREWAEAATACLDLLEDAAICQVVKGTLEDAERANLEAEWWATLPVVFDADDAFEVWLLIRDGARVRPEPPWLEQWTPEERAERKDRKRSGERQMFDLAAADSASNRVNRHRSICERILSSLLPLLTANADGSTVGPEAFHGGELSPSEPQQLGFEGWKASNEVLVQLRRQVRDRVHRLVLPFMPQAWRAKEWATLVTAALSLEEDRKLVVPQRLMAACEWANTGSYPRDARTVLAITELLRIAGPDSQN